MEGFDIGNILYFILILISLVAGALQQSKKAKKIPKADPNERRPIDPMDELDEIFGKKEEPEPEPEEEVVESTSTQKVEDDYFEKMHKDLEQGTTIDRKPTIDNNVIEGQLSTLEDNPFYSTEDIENLEKSNFKEATSIFDSQEYKDVMTRMEVTQEGIDFDLRMAIIYSEILNKPKALPR